MNGWSCLQEATARMHAAFVTDLADPLGAQKRQLHEILLRNRDTGFGRRHGFSAIRGVDDYRARVPVCTYETLADDIRAMANGRDRILTGGDVVIYEETAGSTGAAKLIPYTRDALDAFRRAIYPWIGALLMERPAIMRGRSYWALSPVARNSRMTPDGTPLGMASDADYLEAPLARAFGALSVTPAAIASITDVDTWRYLTLRCLVDAGDLTLISIWSPTFLFPLLEALQEQAPRLIDDIEHGTVDLESSPGVRRVADSLRPDPARAAVVAAALSGPQSDLGRLWPLLDTVSCWTSGSAGQFIGTLQAYLPAPWIQGKGLLACEGVVTIPLPPYAHPVLALNSGFYEFLDSGGQSRLADELSEGECYRVVMTTHGGLYRYELGDRVRMLGWAQASPMLEFAGRAGVVSDLCGEKLSEDFVQGVLPDTCGFTMLAPSLRDGAHYVLYVDAARCSGPGALTLASQMDQALQANPQYRYARRLGQLGAVRVSLVTDPLERFVAVAVERGQRLAVIKPPSLRQETDWDVRFSA